MTDERGFNELTDIFTSDLVKRALRFAATAHETQTRKYTKEPYITHPVIVAGLVASVGGSKAMVAAALLHDVVEDCGVKIETLFAEFGQDVANLVYWLTDVSQPSNGNRTMRKALDREHLAKAPAEAQTIKLADLLDNTQSIVKHDPDFAKVYMKEKLALLDVLTDGDQSLYARATELVKAYFQENSDGRA